MRTLVPSLVLATALAVAGCTTNPFNPPPPADSPGAYPPVTATPGQETPGQSVPASPDAPAPEVVVTDADLPTAQDLVWNDGASWTAGETREGEGTERITACQQNRLDSLGPTAVWVRTFDLSGDGGSGAAVAMSFESTALADQAYGTLQDWTANCTTALQAQNRTDARQAIPAQPIPVPDGRAQFTEWVYGIGPDLGEFESQGVYQVGDRVGLLVMRIQGQDNNWDLEPDGPVGMLHPQIRSVPPAAEKLAL
jgi:hypothetical protein